MHLVIPGKVMKHWATQDFYGIDFSRWLLDLGAGTTFTGTPAVRVLTNAGADVTTEFEVAGQAAIIDATKIVRLLERGTNTGTDQREDTYILVAECGTSVTNVSLSAAVILVMDQRGRPPLT